MKTKYKIILLILVAIVPLSYAVYTGHIWEDYYITFKFSRNLVEGNGVVYNTGEKVHGFTSPLGMLLPALCYWISGSENSALWLFRIMFCVPAFVGTGYFLLRILESIFPARIMAVWFCFFLYLFEAKSVMFSVNGMETAFMLFFLAWSCAIAVEGFRGKYFQLGIAWAGLMWTRPDSCVYIAAFVFSWFIFSSFQRKSQIIFFIKAALICAVLYLPWFIWAWTYYGSPIPNTVLAKGLGSSSGADAFKILWHGVQKLYYIPGWVFFPVYPQFGPWHYAMILFSLFVGYLSALTWLLPKLKCEQKSFSLFFCLSILYLTCIQFAYPWYFPPAAFLGIISFGIAIDAIIEYMKMSPLFKTAIFATITCPFLFFFIFEIDRMKDQQEIIESGHRTIIGKWLKDNVKENETIYLESLGYIGYFSEKKIRDWPGLIAPQVVKARREKNSNFISTVEEIKPDWVLCRKHEVAQMEKNSYFKKNYELSLIFDVREKIMRNRIRLGVGYLLYDSAYCIYRRKN